MLSFTADNKNQPNKYDEYTQLTNEEKQERQRQRRNKRKQAPGLDPKDFDEKVTDQFDKLEYAFDKIASENDAGRITVTRDGNETLVVEVKKIGIYAFRTDASVQTITLTSPESGTHIYQYDIGNGFWKSSVQVHILEELIVREFCGHSQGLLDL